MAAISGLMIAIAAYFIGNRLLPVTLENRGDQEIQVFFLVWLAALIHALLRPSRAVGEQVALGTVLWLAVPVINVVTTIPIYSLPWRGSTLPWQCRSGVSAFAGAGGYTFWRLIRKPAPARPRKNRLNVPRLPQPRLRENA